VRREVLAGGVMPSHNFKKRPDETFSQANARFNAEKAEREGRSPPKSTEETAATHSEEDLLPELNERSESDLELDRIVEKVDVLEAYRRWCGKSQPVVGNQREGIKISCPKPDHPDNNPSAWINLDEGHGGLWFCGGCQVGGDKLDIAAYHFGFDVPGYKNGANFHRLREAIAEDYGYRIKKVPGGTVIQAPEDEPAASESPQITNLLGETDKSTVPAREKTDDKESNVIPLHAVPEDEETNREKVSYPDVPWRDIVPEDTFLRDYMEATCNDDAPESYHYWHGLIALGHAAGRRVHLEDKFPIYGNFLLCLLGATGVGKSNSRRHLTEVLRAVLPFRDSGLDTSGCKIVPVPGSGEVLIKAFQYEARDPSNPKLSLGYRPVNGIVNISEFAALMAIASRQGSTLVNIIQQFADCDNEPAIMSLRSGTMSASEPFCTVTSSTQPKAIRKLLSKYDAASGFLNRWVFAGGIPKKEEVLGGSHSSRVIDLSESIDKLRKVAGWAGIPRTVTVPPDVFKEMEIFWDTVVTPSVENDESDLLSRLRLTLKRIILLNCVNEHRTEATLEMINNLKPLFKYLVSCYAILNENIGMTLGKELVADIENYTQKIMKQTNHGASVRDLSHSMHDKYPIEMVKKTLDIMVSLDMIELEPKAKGPGRPTIRYRMVKND
jgi:hypothetical protein